MATCTPALCEFSMGGPRGVSFTVISPAWQLLTAHSASPRNARLPMLGAELPPPTLGAAAPILAGGAAHGILGVTSRVGMCPSSELLGAVAAGFERSTCIIGTTTTVLVVPSWLLIDHLINHQRSACATV